MHNGIVLTLLLLLNSDVGEGMEGLPNMQNPRFESGKGFGTSLKLSFPIRRFAPADGQKHAVEDLVEASGLYKFLKGLIRPSRALQGP